MTLSTPQAPRRLLAALGLAAALVPTAQAQDWNGYGRTDFTFADRQATLVQPAQAAEGRPWLWRMGEFGEDAALDQALLERGLHLAWLDTSETFGSPEFVEQAAAFHQTLVAQHDLRPRALVFGLGVEGLLAHNFAAQHPDRVAAVIAANPVCDTKSWPAGLGLAEGDPVVWARCLEAWGLDEDGMRESGGNPVDRVTDLAGLGIPVLHVVGTADLIVPYSENSQVVQRRMSQVGGTIQAITHDGGSRPFLPVDLEPVIAFAMRHTVQHSDFFEVRAGLERFRAAAESGAARVAFVGGSITYNPGWTRFVMGDLIRAYPESKITFEVAAVPSLDSTAHAFRLADDLLSTGPVDLVIFEAAVNDETNGRSPAETVRGVEGTLRRLRGEYPEVDVLMLHFPSAPVVQNWKPDLERPTVAAIERVAEHYGVPSLDLSAELAGRIAIGEFEWSQYGGVHPVPFGHRIIWRSIQRLMRALDLTTGVAVGEPAPRELPAPLDPGSFAAGEQIDPGAAQAGDGWTLVPEWAPAVGQRGRQAFLGRPTLETTQPDSELTLAFDGDAIGIQVVAGPDTGAISWSIDGGEPQRLELFTNWSRGLHMPWYYVLATGLPAGEHTLTLRSLASEAGSAVRIQEFLVDGH